MRRKSVADIRVWVEKVVRAKSTECMSILMALLTAVLFFSLLVMKIQGLRGQEPQVESSAPLSSGAQGIDVSAFQGDVNWKEVKEEGISFAFIRAGYRGYESGKLMEDEYLDYNLDGCRQNGLYKGIYFFSQAVTPEEAVEEADYCLSLIKGHQIDLPIAYDFEYVHDFAFEDVQDGRTNYLTPDQVCKNAEAFCKRIVEAGYEPMIYMGKSYAGNVYSEKFLRKYPVWVADYTEGETSVSKAHYQQYTGSGKVHGVNGDVDRNLYLC